MNNNKQFEHKWSDIRDSDKDKQADEKSIFVDIGNEPITQRQLNLYYYFQFIKSILEKQNPKDVCEIGCGRGTIGLYLAKYLGLKTTLLDSSQEAIELAKEAFKNHNQNAEFNIADATKTNLEAEVFDAIVSIGLAEHLDNVDDLFAEQYRLLRPGGVMISLNIPKKTSIQILNKWMRSIKKVFGKYKEKVGKDYYRNTYNPPAYANFAKKVGFENVEITNVCPFPIYTPINIETDKFITKLNKIIISFRKLWMKYPYKTNFPMSQAHFLVAYKPKDDHNHPPLKKGDLESKKINNNMTTEQIWKKMTEEIFIIAEAGKNFIQTEEDRPVSEYLSNAKVLVDKAVEGGADCIKWQTHHAEDEQLNIEVVSPHFKGGDRYKWVTRNEKATPINEFWKPLKAYCEEKGILFMTTPMSRGAAKIANEVGVDIWKIGSGDILDFPTLDYIRNTGKPIIISSGMSTMEEIEKSLNYLKEKNNRVMLLHCVSKYPCDPEELRLGTIEMFKDHFNVPIGFSDHSVGIEPDLVAVALGATLIEKHFSLSRDLWGSDHKVSMTPEELKELVIGTKEVIDNPKKQEEILATDYAKKAREGKEKVLQEGEAVFRPLFRKSLQFGQDIAAGTVITKEMVYAMRPQKYAGGLPSEEYETILGKKLTEDVKKFDPITKNKLS